jgi:hypothetical protein
MQHWIKITKHHMQFKRLAYRIVSPEVAHDEFPLHTDHSDHCVDTTQSRFLGVDDTEIEGDDDRTGATLT